MSGGLVPISRAATLAAVTAAFPRLNGARFEPDHAALLRIVLGVAAGAVSCECLADWIEVQIAR